jgi:hypothetical protein
MMVHLELRISLPISIKTEMALTKISGVRGKIIHEKYLNFKISWHCPFKQQTGLSHAVLMSSLLICVATWPHAPFTSGWHKRKCTSLRKSAFASEKIYSIPQEERKVWKDL